MSPRLLVLLLTALPLNASTVLLTVTGRVSTTTAGDFFPSPPISVGDTWTATVTYAYPTLATPPGFLGIENYYDPNGQVMFSVNGLFLSGSFVGGFVGGIGTPQMEASLGSSDPSPSPGRASLRWFGDASLVLDTSGLPDSFSKWNLPSASSFSLLVISPASFPGAGDSWSVTADDWDTMSIQVIPEPAAAGLALATVLAMAGRRRRVPA